MRRLSAGSSRAPRNFQRDFAHFFVNAPVRRQNHRPAQFVRLPLEIADSAARLFDKKNARGDVPLVEPKFPETIEAAGSDGRKIQGGGAIAAYALRPLREFAVILQIRAELAIARGKPGTKQAR